MYSAARGLFSPKLSEGIILYTVNADGLFIAEWAVTHCEALTPSSLVQILAIWSVCFAAEIVL